MSRQSQRHMGLDVVRCIALFSVIAVHFFLNTGFYEEPVIGGRMVLFVYLRSALMISIPLFLMSSGYLLKDKKVSPAYYLRIIKILFFYVCISILYAIYRIYMTEPPFTRPQALLGVLGFSTLSYSWYIEMYCGLFLLIPFLNILYRELETQRQKQWLLVCLMFLTAAPGILNVYRFDSLQWWLSPASNRAYQHLIPQWWTGIYPLTYYFLGCYLREYPLRIPARRYWLLIPGCILLTGSFNLYRSWGVAFLWDAWQDWESGFNLVLSVLIFSYCVQGNFRYLGNSSRKVVSWMAELSLGAYLFSQLFDFWFYGLFNSLVPQVQDRLIWMPAAVAAVLGLSLASSHVLNSIYRDTVAKLVDRVKEKLAA